jgi:hypothetical protein
MHVVSHSIANSFTCDPLQRPYRCLRVYWFTEILKLDQPIKRRNARLSHNQGMWVSSKCRFTVVSEIHGETLHSSRLNISSESLKGFVTDFIRIELSESIFESDILSQKHFMCARHIIYHAKTSDDAKMYVQWR